MATKLRVAGILLIPGAAVAGLGLLLLIVSLFAGPTRPRNAAWQPPASQPQAPAPPPVPRG